MRNYNYEYENNKRTDEVAAAGRRGCCAAGAGVCGGAWKSGGGTGASGAYGAGAEGDAGGDCGAGAAGAYGAI